jgi:PKD repeat protein
LTVDFTSVASGGVAPYRFAWSFGVAGATSTAQNATYTYLADGAYTASLVVTDLIGDRASDSALVTVATPPALTAAAAASPADGVVPFVVAFSGSATGGVLPYHYAWNFGPAGASSTAQNPTYGYSSAGSYNASLTVTDAVGTTATAWVVVAAGPALSATFTATPAAPYCSSGSGFSVVMVAANVSGGSGGYSYSWTFPAGVANPGSIPQTSLIVSVGATYPLSLRVTDSSGSAVSTYQNVTADSVSCTSSSAGFPGVVDWLLWILIAIVVAVIGVELILLLRRREK